MNLLSDFEAMYGADLIGGTIIRVRGVVHTLGAADPPETLRFAVRVGASSEGGTEGGDPLTSPYLDWMAWESFIVGGAATGLQNGSDVESRKIDVKSMRKLDEVDQELQLWLAYRAAAPALVQVNYDLSILLKLA